MKKFLAILLAAVLVLSCVGCGTIQRENYTKGTKKYVKLCSLTDIQVKESDELFQQNLATRTQGVMEQFKTEVKDGSVERGDVANINYAGRVDGIAFLGGTSEDYDLQIGSGTFVPGFEDQIIGMVTGETKDITVTFPDGYNTTKDLETKTKTLVLANQEVVFTVTVNKISRSYTELCDELAVKAGYQDKNELESELKKSALMDCLYNHVIDNSTIKRYPADSEGSPFNYYKAYYTSYAAQNGGTFEDFLQNNGLTEEQMREETTEGALILYAIADKLKIKVSADEVTAEIDKLIADGSVTAEDVESMSMRSMAELDLISEAAMNRLVEDNPLISDT